MDGLVIGLDLCDIYTQVSCFGREDVWTIPTVICKKKEADEWYVGEEAYGLTLVGQGIIVDKLLSLVMKDGTATLEGVKYTGMELLQKYLKRVLALPAEGKETQVSQLVITLQTIDVKMMDALMYCADYVGIPRDHVHIISHAESFSYYVLSQKKEVWNSHVGLFELSEERLCYYELQAQRGMKKMTVLAEYENLEEGFNLDILKTASGMKLADKILCSCADRLMQKKLYSAVFLTGKGFESQEWAPDFMRMVCSKRRVYAENGLFAKGAAYKSMDDTQDKSSYPFVMICEGHLNVTISVPVLYKERGSQLILAAAGDNWYECKSTVDLIADGQDYVEFQLAPLHSRETRLVRIPLEGFPKRPPRTTRVQIQVGFLDERTMAVAIKDKGFGEMFPASDAVVKQEVML